MKAEHEAFRKFWGRPKKDEMRITYTLKQTKVLTDIPPTVDRYSADNQWSAYRPSVAAISTEISADSRPICRLSLGRYLGWYIGRYVDRRHISVDISTDTRPICRPTYRSTLGWYVDRYIGGVSVDMSTEMSTDLSVEGCTKYTWFRRVKSLKIIILSKKRFRSMLSVRLTLQAGTNHN